MPGVNRIPFTNFANYRRMSPDGTVYGGNPFDAVNPLDGSSAPWTWYEEPVHESVPFWRSFDGTITYLDRALLEQPPTFLPDGRVLFVFPTVTAVEARDIPGGDVTEHHHHSNDATTHLYDRHRTRSTHRRRGQCMVFSLGVHRWQGGPSARAAFLRRRERNRMFAKDAYEFVGDQFMTYNAQIAYPLVPGLTPSESIQSTILFTRHLIGAVGELVRSGRSKYPGPSTGSLVMFSFFGAATFVRRWSRPISLEHYSHCHHAMLHLESDLSGGASTLPM